MKKIQLITLTVILLITFSCNTGTEPVGSMKSPKVQVKTTTILQGYLPNYIELSGKTVCLNKNNIVAPISGYVTKVNVQKGDKITKGTILFEMQSREAYVMNKNNNLNKNIGSVKITSPNSGIINDLWVVQKNIYLDQGSVMCSITALQDIKIQANIPYEFKKYVKLGSTCKIVLPDNNIKVATFSKVLPQMDEQAQTIKILANFNTKNYVEISSE